MNLLQSGLPLLAYPGAPSDTEGPQIQHPQIFEQNH